MKSRIAVCSFLLSFCIFVSCQKFDTNIAVPSSSSSYDMVSRDHVSLNDIRLVVERDYPSTKSNSQYQIFPYIGENSDTLMYIVNLPEDGGWRIFSSDKRTPAIVAEGDRGRFSLEEGNPAVKFWMAFTAESMKRISMSNDDDLMFGGDVINTNRSFWSSTPLSVIDPPVIDFPSGHWEVDTLVTNEIVDSVKHMVPQWDQDDPYNRCCPYLISDTSKRAPVGCVAVAGAQMLYYLQTEKGFSIDIPRYGFCDGTVRGYEQSFSTFSTDAWSQIGFNYISSSNVMLQEAILLGYIGLKVNMHYCDNIFGVYSWAIPRDLISDVFSPCGITCYHSDYDENEVKTSLGNGMPVIVSASDLMVPADGDIHCFVIDGYRRRRYITSYFHHYVLDRPTTIPYPIEDPYTTYSYSSPYISEISINWGWSSQWTSGINDGWYSLTAGWTVVNGNEHDYNHYIKMIYNFQHRTNNNQ